MLSTRISMVVVCASVLAACGDSGGSAGFCENENDQEVFAELSVATGEDGAGAVAEAATSCGLSQDCGGALGTVAGQDIPSNREALSVCVEACVVEETGLTPSCAGCYGDITACSVGACAGACLSDSGSAECLDCVETECLGAFSSCI